MSKSALEIVQNFQMSLGSGGNDWIKLISEDIHFKGPVDECKGKQNFIALNEGFLPRVRGYEPLNAFGNDQFASLEGTFKVETPKGNIINLLMAEVYTVKNQQIESIRVYYDAEEFRNEFA